MKINEKELRETFNNFRAIDSMTYFIERPEAMKSVKTLLNLAQSFLVAQTVMPEKIEKVASQDPNVAAIAQLINDIIDSCTLAHLKKVGELEAKIKELETVLDAWHDVFGTTQLTHAKARLDEAENFSLKKTQGVVMSEEEICPYKDNGRPHYEGQNLKHQITNGVCVLCGKKISSYIPKR